MKTILARVGLQILILTICTAVTIPGFLLQKNSDAGTSDFILVKKSDGIELYERWNTIGPDQLAREVKAIFVVQSDINTAAALVKDEAKGIQWNKGANTYKVIDKGKDHWICYIQYNLPWPVNNQDCVLQYNVRRLNDGINITFKSTVHALFPVHDGISRIHDIAGKWIFTKTHRGVKVEYYITTTPNKSLPRWATDPIIRNNLMETMQAFRGLLEKKTN